MIETATSLITLGSLGFWVSFIIASLIVIAAVENELPKFAGLVLLILGFLTFKSLNNHFTLQSFLVYAAFYLLIGGVWSVFKWYFYVKKGVDGARLSQNISYDSACLKREFSPAHNKQLIFSWIAFWVWSMVWTLIRDAVEWVFEFFRGIYQKITDKLIAGVVPDDIKDKK